MSETTPETLRKVRSSMDVLFFPQGMRDELDACADAWEADRLAGHEWRIEGEGLRKRLAAAERAIQSALSDLLFVERVGPEGTNMRASVLLLEEWLKEADDE